MGRGKIRVDPMSLEAGDLIVTDGRMSLELGDVLLAVCKLSDTELSQSNSIAIRNRTRDIHSLTAEEWETTGVCCLVWVWWRYGWIRMRRGWYRW